MNTPIADFIDSYAASDTVRFHMPGHKGKGDIERYDITEITGADVLYSADGIISESEKNTASLFGTAHTYYSTEGSTLAIKAMLMLASKGKSKTVLAARNVHKAFVYGCALLDLSVRWLYPREADHLCACRISANEVRDALSQMEEKPCAVYVTSPDYLGNVADIESIAKVCKEAGVPLLCDNAHGAYLNFLTPSLHPIALGAAMCADSAHKTLPVLTGGAYLHVSKDYPEFCSGARQALSLFASTSPSYLILRSLDKCCEYLCDGFKEKLREAVCLTDEAKAALWEMGIPTKKSEPLKIVISCPKIGYSGTEAALALRRENIECEFCDCDFIVLMTSTKTTRTDIDRLLSAFSRLEVKEPLASLPKVISRPEKALSIRDAILSESETVAVKDALARVCADPSVSCPPAVPIAVSGEVLSQNELLLLERYGIDKVDVVKI